MKPVQRAGSVLVALMLFDGCSDDDSDTVVVEPQTIFGNGAIKEEERPVTGFSGVSHASEGAVRIEQQPGAPPTLRVRADENLLPHILTDVQDSTLRIRTGSNVDLEPTQTIEFFVAVAELDSLVFTGVGEVELPSLSADRLSIMHSGVGSIDCLDLTATVLDLEHTGLGSVRCAGRVDEQTVIVSGVGEYDAPRLESREATVTVSGFGSATVNVSERLTANVSGGGSVTYIDSSGGGLIVECTPPSGCEPSL